MQLNGPDDFPAGPTLVSQSVCAICGDNFLLRGTKFAQLIEIEDALDIRTVENPRGSQRVCFSFVPLAATIAVCMPCWDAEQFGELRRYAHAPLAAEVRGI